MSFWTFCARSCDRFLLRGVGKCTIVRYARTRPLPIVTEKPKRPPSSWLLYFTERGKELRQQAEYETLSLSELSKKISQEWRNFDELDKIPYKEKYTESLGDYKRRMEDYKLNLTPEEKKTLRSMKLDKKQEMRAFEKEFPKPKNPGNGYILFVKACLRENTRGEDEDMKDWVRGCAQRWHNLDEETRLKLNDEASSLGSKYREELREWKEKYEEWRKGDASSN